MTFLSSLSQLLLKTSIFLILFLLSFTTKAQQKYTSLLWEITGNNLTKPSYLYGTMHVSNKLAYHLSDSFFVALTNVNVVGLESNPDQWLGNMKKLGLLEIPTYGGANTNFYKDAFKLAVPNNKQFSGILAYNPDLINGLLYRNNNYNQDHEESTYIDLFIYKAGSKLNKNIVSLENFKTSMVMATKADTRDPGEEYDVSKKNVDFTKVQSQINDAYRNGNLDVLDSLTKLINPSKNYQKYLLDDRNIILAHTIDSICKTNTLFAGIGAAHLPGNSGVIELLRKMGYKLRPITNIATKKGMKQKESIESIVKKLPASKHYSKDSLFTYDLFEEPVELANIEGFSFALATDMANGSYYTISRQITYAPLYNYKVANMHAKIDSLLYESIPGKIISKKDIVSNSGIKGFDITNQTKQGDLQRYQIYILDNELIVFKMAGKGNYMNEPEAIRFFNSIKFMPEKKYTQITFSPETKGFEVSIPSTYKFINNKKSGIQGMAEDLYAYKSIDNSSFGVMHYFYHDYDYLEEDTFELNMLCKGVLKNFNYNVNVTKNFAREQQLPCLIFSAENTNLHKIMNAKLFIKGVHYYLVYAITDKAVSPQIITGYFNSFKIVNFKYIFPTPVVTDHEFAFTVKDEAGNDIVNAVTADLAGFYKELKAKEDDKKFKTDFEYQSFQKTYYSPSSAEHVNINYEKFNDYDYRNPDKFWDDVKKHVQTSTTFNISKYDVKHQGNTHTANVILKDTASSNLIKRKYILKDGLLFCLSAICDSVTGTTGWTEDFLNTFKHQDTVFTKPIFENKISTLLKDLSSPDSSLRYAAKQSLSANSWDKVYTKFIFDYYQSPEFLKLDEESRAILLVNGGTFEDEKVIPIYKNLYAKYADSSYMQICIIKGLGLLKTKNSYNTIYDLLKNQTPLTGEEANIVDVLSPLYDSLELCSNYFPGLFSLSTYDEYKNPIRQLFTDLVIRKIIPAAKYATQVPVLLTEATNEFKRYSSSSSKSNKTNYDDDYTTAAAEALANMLENSLSNEKSISGKKTYPSYNTMIENYAVILAPYYQTNAGVKQYFDKLLKVKNEQILLNVCLIANEHKIAVNDTLWKYFSNQPKTKIKLYNELRKINQLQKFDKKNLSQVAFCKTLIEASITTDAYNNKDESVKQKVKQDSVYFLRKEKASNKYENGFIYFFNRVDAKTKVINLAIAFVDETDETKISTKIDIIDDKRVVEVGKTIEETISAILAEFHYKFRKRYVSDTTTPNYNYGE